MSGGTAHGCRARRRQQRGLPVRWRAAPARLQRRAPFAPKDAAADVDEAAAEACPPSSQASVPMDEAVLKQQSVMLGMRLGRRFSLEETFDWVQNAGFVRSTQPFPRTKKEVKACWGARIYYYLREKMLKRYNHKKKCLFDCAAKTRTCLLMLPRSFEKKDCSRPRRGPTDDPLTGYYPCLATVPDEEGKCGSVCLRQAQDNMTPWQVHDSWLVDVDADHMDENEDEDFDVVDDDTDFSVVDEDDDWEMYNTAREAKVLKKAGASEVLRKAAAAKVLKKAGASEVLRKAAAAMVPQVAMPFAPSSSGLHPRGSVTSFFLGLPGECVNRMREEITEPRAQSPEPRAQSQEPRAQSAERRAQSPEPRAQSPEARALSSGPRAMATTWQ